MKYDTYFETSLPDNLHDYLDRQFKRGKYAPQERPPRCITIVDDLEIHHDEDLLILEPQDVPDIKSSYRLGSKAHKSNTLKEQQKKRIIDNPIGADTQGRKSAQPGLSGMGTDQKTTRSRISRLKDQELHKEQS